MVPLHGDGVLAVLAVVGVVAIGHLVSLLGVQLGRSYIQHVQLGHTPTTESLSRPSATRQNAPLPRRPQILESPLFS